MSACARNLALIKNRCYRSSILAHLAGSFVVGLFLWLAVIYAIRYTLKLLLMYKGWMYEARGKGRKPSKLTQVWLLLVKLFSGWHKPMLYSFQGSLPRLPLPTVPDTMKRVSSTYFMILNINEYLFFIRVNLILSILLVRWIS